jgi:uncharacterized protein (TIGR04255 family)
MPPRFPEVERIELKRSPLELVVCQVRFPTILSLAANQPPDEFQRRIRTTYPIGRWQRRTNLEVSAEAAARVAVSPFWSFEDRESRWTVSLGQNFISLETKSYQRFDDFIARFLEVFEIAKELYPIELRERLGLRYLDRIARDKQPTLPPDWPARVRREIIPLRAMRGENEPQLGNIEVRFSFGDHFLTIRSAYVDAGFSGAVDDELLLDFDCYTERRADLESIDTLLREFRAISYRAFRWAIGDLINCFEHEDQKVME